MEAITAALLIDGVWWIILGAILAGIVRGFTGFGTAMVYLPFAGAVLSPVGALLSLVCMDIFGPLPLVPNALRKGHPRDIALMGIGLILTLPIGVFILGQMEGTMYRYVVSIVTIIAHPRCIPDPERDTIPGRICRNSIAGNTGFWTR